MATWTKIGDYRAPQRTRYNEVPLYEQGLYRVGKNTYAWMVPNGSWGEANAGLIVGEGESLLVDTLWDADYTREMLGEMGSLVQDAPIRTVVNTHADGDHFFGNQLLDVETITSSASLEDMKENTAQAMLRMRRLASIYRFFGRLGNKRARKFAHYGTTMLAPYNFDGVTCRLPTTTFDSQKTILVGGRPVHLIEVGPAHTRGDLMVLVPDAKVLFSADILFVNSTPVMWAGPVENWIRALDRILAMDVETIVPGHGPVTDKSSVKQVKTYWEYVHAAVAAEHRVGTEPHEAARRIALSDNFQLQPFALWNSPERIMVSTHTIYRNLDGRTDPISTRELVIIMRHQAQLAFDLPNAEPQLMRRLA